MDQIQLSTENDSLTLREAREILSNNAQKGSDCLCCGQFVKLYKRTLYATPALCLIEFYKLSLVRGVGSYIHIQELIESSPRLLGKITGGDFHKAFYWGLLEEMPKDPQEVHKKTSGFWKITPKGVDFVNGNISIPKYAVIYDGKVIGFEGSQMKIANALGKSFNYAELMSI